MNINQDNNKANSCDFTVKFNVNQTNKNEVAVIDAKTIGSTLLTMSDMFNEFHNKTQENEQLLVKARPFAKGSFEIPLELILIGTGILLSKPDYFFQAFQVIMDRIQSYFEIKQRLKGNPLRIKGENVVIIEDSTVTLDSVVFNILNSDNNATENQFINTINEIRQDPTILSIDFQCGTLKKTIASIRSEDYDYFTTKSKISEKTIQEGINITTKRTWLTIQKAVLTGRSQWGVKYGDKTISVSIVHEDFLEQVNKGVQRFGAGDTLEVDLEITEIYDEKLKSFQENKYRVMHVYGHNIYKPTNRYALLDLALDGGYDSESKK